MCVLATAGGQTPPLPLKQRQRMRASRTLGRCSSTFTLYADSAVTCAKHVRQGTAQHRRPTYMLAGLLAVQHANGSHNMRGEQSQIQPVASRLRIQYIQYMAAAYRIADSASAASKKPLILLPSCGWSWGSVLSQNVGVRWKHQACRAGHFKVHACQGMSSHAHYCKAALACKPFIAPSANSSSCCCIPPATHCRRRCQSCWTLECCSSACETCHAWFALQRRLWVQTRNAPRQLCAKHLRQPTCCTGHVATAGR